MDRDVVMLLLGALLSFPIGIVANIFTPWLQRRVERGQKNLSSRTLDQLKAELDLITDLHDHPAKIAVRSVQSFGLAFVLYVSGNIIWALPLWAVSDYLNAVGGLLAVLLFVIAILLTVNHLKLISKTIRFEAFRSDALARIRFSESGA